MARWCLVKNTLPFGAVGVMKGIRLQDVASILMYVVQAMDENSVDVPGQGERFAGTHKLRIATVNVGTMAGRSD